MHTRLDIRLVSSLLAIALRIASPVHAQDGPEAHVTLADAQRLYAEADYNGALNQFERLTTTDREPRNRHAIDLYRTLCLVALGRMAEADAAMTSLIQHEPFYAPTESDMPPRVLAAFNDKRRLLLPAIIQSRFEQAKRDFDDRRQASAINGFDDVLKMLTLPVIAEPAGRPPLSDLVVLANGFKNLASAAIAQAPAPAATPSPKPQPPAGKAPAAAAAPPEPTARIPKIYDTSSTNVVPPVTLKQELPRALSTAAAGKIGELFIVVDEIGTVESAIITESIDPAYDRILLASARKWTYRPATLDGAVVKYRKRIQVVLPQ